MAADPSHQQWVSKLKLRMPRHIRNDSADDTPLVECQSWPQPDRWYEAHKEEIERWKNNAPHSMKDTMEIVRKELATVGPLFAPARYTTIVEGRPVQAQLYNPIPNLHVSFLVRHGVFGKNSNHIERAFLLAALLCIYLWA